MFVQQDDSLAFLHMYITPYIRCVQKYNGTWRGWIIKVVKKERSDGGINENEKIDHYIGYCSLTAPLLNFKQGPWEELRADRKMDERQAAERQANIGC